MKKTFSYVWTAYGYGEIEAESEEEAEDKLYAMEETLKKEAEGFSIEQLEEVP
jgi:hypothetical protein